MIFAAIVGFVFWDEVPVTTTWIGAAIIAASGLFIFLRRQKVNPSARPVEPVVIE
jgi:LPXTG-motif cell wall-anchored protein